jgi:hypothetical protein
MKTIEEVQKEKEPNLIRKMLTYDWIFSTSLEKIILVLMCGLAMYGIWRLIF